MSFTRIDARTIFVTNTPQLAVYPDKPEPPRVEDRKLDCKQVMKKFRWTSEQFDAAIAMPTFPISSKRSMVGSWRITLVWSEHMLDRWAAEQRVLAAEIKSLLGA